MEWGCSLGSQISHSGFAFYHDNIRKHILSFKQESIEIICNRIMRRWLLREFNWNTHMVSIRTCIWLGQRGIRQLSKQFGNYGMVSALFSNSTSY